MLIWKFIRMVWAQHAATAPAPLWIIPPDGLIDLHPRLINLPPSVIKLLGQGTTQEKIDIMNINTHELKAKWTQRGISPALLGSRLHNPLVQPWVYRETPGTPQQNNFSNTSETRLACGIYTVLSSLYAIRNWEVDFTQQIHIRQARNWMAAIGHAIHQVVSLHRCRCGAAYEQWESEPTPPCPTCGSTSLVDGESGTKKRAHNDITNQTPEANFPAPAPVPIPGHAQNHRPKRRGERLGPAEKSGNSKSTTMRIYFPRMGGRGLRNDGNTCFLNAVIQCLGVIEEVNHAHEPTIAPLTTQTKLLNCVRELQLPGTAYIPTPLIQQIPHLIRHKKGDQADAHELLIAVINDLSPPTLQIFQGQMASTVQCAHCNGVTTTTAHTQDISLHIEEGSHVSLGERLLKFFQTEILEDDNSYWCDSCIRPTKAMKTLSYTHVPTILIIHLKRLIFGKKLNPCM